MHSEGSNELHLLNKLYLGEDSTGRLLRAQGAMFQIMQQNNHATQMRKNEYEKKNH